VLYFDTAWSPPVPVLEALAKRFPEHEIIVNSVECMNGWHATFTLKNGEVMGTTEDCHCFDEHNTTEPAPSGNGDNGLTSDI
jgi:hypothetical protein